MRYVLRLLLTIALALAVGFGLSYLVLDETRMIGGSVFGAWIAWPDAGSPRPDPYTLARLTRQAALPLGRGEGMQLIAATDDLGRPLTRACAYRLHGHFPLSRFWTLVGVDENWINLAAPGSDAALRSSEIARQADGATNIAIGTELMAGNWLELTGQGPFKLALTLYDTTTLSSFDASGALPTLTRLTCR